MVLVHFVVFTSSQSFRRTITSLQNNSSHSVRRRSFFILFVDIDLLDLSYSGGFFDNQWKYEKINEKVQEIYTVTIDK